MPERIKTLIVEDNPDDADLLLLHLKKNGFTPEHTVVKSAGEYEHEILNNEWDIILSDYDLPGFSGMEALEILKETGKDIPFILISGTVGESTAVESVLAGANDYMLKDNLTRLKTSIIRELNSKKLRKEKRHKEAALEKSEMRFEQLFANSIDGIFITRYTDRIINANPAAHRILGYSEEEFLQLKRRDLVNFEDQAVVNAYKKRDEEGSFRGRLHFKHKKGHYVPVEVSSQLYKVSDKENQTSTIFRDITNQLMAEKALKESLKEKEVMLAEVHHRVKNNMAVISGLLSLQADAQDDDMIKGLLQQSISRIQSMATVHEMLYSSESFAKIDLRNYINELLQNIKKHFTVNQNISFQIDAQSVLMGMTDAIPCGLILNELVTNALKHAFTDSAEGTIHIRLKVVDDEILLEVEDDGVGISDSSVLQDKEQLGLTIVNALTEQLHANLEIQTKNGLHYILTFPKK